MVDFGFSEVLDAVIAVFVPYITYSMIRAKERFDDILSRLLLVETNKISESKARQIIAHEIADIKETLHKIADTVVQIRVDQAKIAERSRDH